MTHLVLPATAAKHKDGASRLPTLQCHQNVNLLHMEVGSRSNAACPSPLLQRRCSSYSSRRTLSQCTGAATPASALAQCREQTTVDSMHDLMSYRIHCAHLWWRQESSQRQSTHCAPAASAAARCKAQLRRQDCEPTRHACTSVIIRAENVSQQLQCCGHARA